MIEEAPATQPGTNTAEPPQPSTFSFEIALTHLKANRSVTRVGWNGPNQWLALQTPDEHSKMTLPFIFISTVQGDLVPWLASQTDLLADDWALW
jgi:hypothetical protein